MKRRVLDTPAATEVAGHRHPLVIHFDGTVFAFGDNSIGQLGDPGFSGAFSAAPRRVSALSGAVAGSASDTNLVQLGDGSAWAWGGNVNGQTGSGSVSTSPVRTPTRIGRLDLN